MTFYDYDNEKLRAQIRRRYTRRFFLGAHGAILILSIVVSALVPALMPLTLLVLVAFVPHALYVAYHEYHYWLEHKIDKKIYGDSHDAPAYDSKRKRYADDFVDEPTFRLTDDGEIEEMPPTHKAKRGRQDYTYEETREPYREQSSKRRDDRRDDDDKKRRKKDKKRRKFDFDTDEFDVKKLLKKFKDIID